MWFLCVSFPMKFSLHTGHEKGRLSCALNWWTLFTEQQDGLPLQRILHIRYKGSPFCSKAWIGLIQIFILRLVIITFQCNWFLNFLSRYSNFEKHEAKWIEIRLVCKMNWSIIWSSHQNLVFKAVRKTHGVLFHLIGSLNSRIPTWPVTPWVFGGAHEFHHNTKNRPPKKIPHEDRTAGIIVPPPLFDLSSSLEVVWMFSESYSSYFCLLIFLLPCFLFVFLPPVN